MFAFFNRRSFLRQWKKGTSGLTKAQILEVFHQYDRNGDLSLNKKELLKLLKHFKCEMSDADAESLIRRFDRNGDGELDLNEFMVYIEQEINSEGSKADTVSVSDNRFSSSVDDLSFTENSRGRQQNRTEDFLTEKLRRRGASADGPVSRNRQSRSSASGLNASSRSNKSSQSRTALPNYSRDSTTNTLEHTDDMFRESETSLSLDWIEHALRKQIQIESMVGKKYFS